MNPDWTQFLVSHEGAESAAAADLVASAPQGARTACVICDLSWYGLIEAVGPDAEAFLHGQLSSDVRALDARRSQLSTYNSAKGRVLATILLWRRDDSFLLQVPGDMSAGLCKRLSMFVLRSRIRLAQVDDRYIRLGVAGAQAEQTLRAAGLTLPSTDFGVSSASDDESAGAGAKVDFLLRLPGERYELLLASAAAAIALWRTLRSLGARPAGRAPWQWLTIRSGIAEIVPQTQDQFVAQMLNYDRLGGISFTKGCYPGQEIVARTQYRGDIKRRTALLHAEEPDAPDPGQAIHAAAASAQPIGTVLSAAPAPDGGIDMLACLHMELAEGADLRLGTVAGPELHRLDLPYLLSAAR